MDFYPQKDTYFYSGDAEFRQVNLVGLGDLYFPFIHFCKQSFYFYGAFQRMEEDSDPGRKRKRRILELQSLANLVSMKLCVLFCAAMKKRIAATLSPSGQDL